MYATKCQITCGRRASFDARPGVTPLLRPFCLRARVCAPPHFRKLHRLCAHTRVAAAGWRRRDGLGGEQGLGLL